MSSLTSAGPPLQRSHRNKPPSSSSGYGARGPESGGAEADYSRSPRDASGLSADAFSRRLYALQLRGDRAPVSTGEQQGGQAISSRGRGSQTSGALPASRPSPSTHPHDRLTTSNQSVRGPASDRKGHAAPSHDGSQPKADRALMRRSQGQRVQSGRTEPLSSLWEDWSPANGNDEHYDGDFQPVLGPSTSDRPVSAAGRQPLSKSRLKAIDDRHEDFDRWVERHARSNHDPEYQAYFERVALHSGGSAHYEDDRWGVTDKEYGQLHSLYMNQQARQRFESATSADQSRMIQQYPIIDEPAQPQLGNYTAFGDHDSPSQYDQLRLTEASPLNASQARAEERTRQRAMTYATEGQQRTWAEAMAHGHTSGGRGSLLINRPVPQTAYEGSTGRPRAQSLGDVSVPSQSGLRHRRPKVPPTNQGDESEYGSPERPPQYSDQPPRGRKEHR
jgi:hypothetical protein